MPEFNIIVEILVLSGAALVAFLVLRLYAARRKSEFEAHVERLEGLHKALLNAQARHVEHIERVVLGAHTQSSELLARAIDARIRGGIEAQGEQLSKLLRSGTEAFASQIVELLRSNADANRQSEEHFRKGIQDEIQAGLRVVKQQVEAIRRELADRRAVPAPIGLANTQPQHELPLNPSPQFFLGAAENPLVRITALASANDRAESGLPIPVTESIRHELGPTLGHAARALAGGAQAAQHHMRMVFSPEVAQGLRDGTLEIMKSRAVDNGIRAMAVDMNGTIRGQASLVQGLNPASVAMGALQIMAVITAQQYLTVINSQLEQIQGGIDNIRDWLSNEVRGRVLGNSDQLRHMAQALKHHEVSELDREVFAHELQTVDREMSQVLKQIEQERRRALAEFRHKSLQEKAFKADGIFGDSLSTVREKFVRELEPCRNTSELTILATRVRAMGIVLRGALGMNERHAVKLVNELCREHDAAVEEFRTWRQELEAEIDAMKSRYRFETTDQETRASLQNATKESFAAVDTDGSELRAVLLNISAAIQQQIAATTRPTEIEVTVDEEGRVIELLRAS